MKRFRRTAKSRKPHLLVAACGSAASRNFAQLCYSFCAGGAEVKAVATKNSLNFINKTAFPREIILYTDEDEWSTWEKIGDHVLHIELPRWADIMVIAPLSANTLAKIAVGQCDDLLTCIVRAWDCSKPLFVAPDMSTSMWDSSVTEDHLMSLDDFGIVLIQPEHKILDSGDYEKGAMTHPSNIYATVMAALQNLHQ